MDEVDIAIILRAGAALIGLAERAYSAGKTTVTKADVDAAFAKADAADAAWQKALAGGQPSISEEQSGG